MSRKGSVKKREVLPDSCFGKVMVAKLINNVMREGKKSVAERIVYKAFSTVEQKLKTDPIAAFDQAVKNVSPSVEVKSRRVGGTTYQVPTPVRDIRGIALALNWIVSSAAGRSEKSMEEKLAAEIMDAYNNRGGAVTIRVNKEKTAEANRAFAYFRW